MSSQLFAGRFKILEQLNNGISTVLILRDAKTSRLMVAKAALKNSEKFALEGVFWIATGNHPNLVRAHAIHTVDGIRYLFIDFVENRGGKAKTLRDLLYEQEPPLNLELILTLLLDLISGLKHFRSLFPYYRTRDIKPENILITNKGRFKLTDFTLEVFGSRGETDQEKNQMSTDGFTFGKPIQNWAESDLNNLGRILNEVLTGTSSYSRDRGIPGASVGKPRKSLENFEMHPTDRLKSLLKKLFESDVKNQFRSLNEAEDMVRQIVRESNLDIKSVPIRTPVMDDVSKETHIRYASLEDSASDELDENSYAAKLLSQYHAKDPWFSKAPALCRSIYQDSDKRIFRTLFFQDLHSPSRLIGGALIWALFSCWTFLAFPIWDAVPTSLLLTILLVERYFNVRTLTTPDALTIPGIGLGLFISWMVTGLHADPIGGDLFMHLAMSLGIFTLLFGINRRFKKQYLGMGTVKLLAMIAAFIGNLALGVLALLPFVGFGYVIFYVAGEPRLKWKNDRLIRTAPTKEVDIPASTLVLISTVIVLIISAVSAHLK